MMIQWNAFCLWDMGTEKPDCRSLQQNATHGMLSDNKFYICSLY